MSTAVGNVTVELGFLPESQAIDDPDHPGLRRAGPRATGPYGGRSIEVHPCSATDLVQDPSARPDLFERGFDVADLSGFEGLQEAFGRVRDAGTIGDDDAATIRAALDGAVLPLAGGRTVKVLYLAGEGFIMRTGGPNAMSLVGPRSQGMNDHGVATSVHGDQDVYGTPLVQLMDGRAPELFRHVSPDGRNDDAALMLVNLWIPLQQVVQPLVLADGRTVDRQRHQVRYGLPTESFLDRDEDQVINDIWTFVHDPGQAWYFRSEMDHRHAYVFDTLSTAHGAGTLPGEELAERCYLALEAAEAAVVASDPVGAAEVVAGVLPVEVPAATPPALGTAIAAMVAVLDEVAAADEAWVARAKAARRAVVRMSLELRVVVSLEPEPAATT